MFTVKHSDITSIGVGGTTRVSNLFQSVFMENELCLYDHFLGNETLVFKIVNLTYLQ